METDNIESLISKTIYKASLYLDEFKWDDWLDLCDKNFYYSIQAFSPEIDKNMIYLDGTFDQMKSITEMLPNIILIGLLYLVIQLSTQLT